jgi:serine/threonine protein kinase
VLGELGRGGMGVVYKARQVALKRPVALKMILGGVRVGDAEWARFRTEAEAAARLQHPNIVQVYEAGEHEGRPFFSMEYVPGGSLADQCAGRPQPPLQAAALAAVLAEAVHYAHQRDVLHRDLKPANILLAPKARGGTRNPEPSPCPPPGPKPHGTPPASLPGPREAVSESGFRISGWIPKIVDFGLARRLGSGGGATQSGMILGTPSYMAPEQAAGRNHELGPATDVYALGAILYELLTGRPPFQGASTLDTLLLVRSTEPVPPRRLRPDLPRDLDTICLKCLHKDPRRRYASAEDLAQDLRRFLAGRPIGARPANWKEKLRRWRRRHPALLCLTAAALVLLAVAGVAALLASRAEERARQAEARLGQARQEQRGPGSFGPVALLRRILSGRPGPVARSEQPFAKPHPEPVKVAPVSVEGDRFVSAPSPQAPIAGRALAGP